MQTQTVAESAPLREELMERLFMDMKVERFNELYYQIRAKTTKHLITSANIVAALAASTALTGMLRNGPGASLIAFQLLMAVAAVSAAVGPLMGLESSYARLEKAALGHQIARGRLWSLLRDLKLSDLDGSHEARANEIGAFLDALSALDEAPRERVRRSCWEKVEREYPAEKAWTII